MEGRERPPHPFDVGGVLLHGNFLHGALKAEEGFDVQRGRLLKARPVLVLRMNLQPEGHTGGMGTDGSWHNTGSLTSSATEMGHCHTWIDQVHSCCENPS